MPSNQSTEDLQYLKALGIDVWVTRDAEEPVPATAANSEPGVAELAASDGPLAISHWSAAELQQSFGSLVVSSDQVGRADILLITEGDGLSAECVKLLGSMFNAIKIDSSEWTQVDAKLTGSQSPSMTSLVQSVQPKAIVLMARSGGTLNGLDALRGVQHRVPSMAPFIVATFHPQDLLDNPDTKRPAWEDLKQLHQWLS